MKKLFLLLAIGVSCLPAATPVWTPYAQFQSMFGSLFSPVPQRIPGPGGGAYAAAVDLYYGDGCSGTTSNTCTAEGSTQGSLTGNSVAAPVTVGVNGLVKACGLDVGIIGDGSVPQFNCAVYQGSSGATTLVCTGTEISMSAVHPVWQENTTFSGCNVTAGTSYVVAIQIKSGINTIKTNGTGTLNQQSFISSTYGTFPSTATWSPGFKYSIYMRVTPN